MFEAYAHVSLLLNLPEVKAFSLLASLIGVAVGLLSLRRVNQVADAQVANFRTEHSRYLNEQRSRIDLATLHNEDAARLVAKSFGRVDAEAAKREALICLYLNFLSSAYAAYQNKLISKAEYEKHMDFFFDDYKGSHLDVEEILSNNYYQSGFDEECRRRLDLLRSKTHGVYTSSSNALTYT